MREAHGSSAPRSAGRRERLRRATERLAIGGLELKFNHSIINYYASNNCTASCITLLINLRKCFHSCRLYFTQSPRVGQLPLELGASTIPTSLVRRAHWLRSRFESWYQKKSLKKFRSSLGGGFSCAAPRQRQRKRAVRKNTSVGTKRGSRSSGQAIALALASGVRSLAAIRCVNALLSEETATHPRQKRVWSQGNTI